MQLVPLGSWRGRDGTTLHKIITQIRITRDQNNFKIIFRIRITQLLCPKGTMNSGKHLFLGRKDTGKGNRERARKTKREDERRKWNPLKLKTPRMPSQGARSAILPPRCDLRTQKMQHKNSLK